MKHGTIFAHLSAAMGCDFVTMKGTDDSLVSILTMAMDSGTIRDIEATQNGEVIEVKFCVCASGKRLYDLACMLGELDIDSIEVKLPSR